MLDHAELQRLIAQNLQVAQRTEALAAGLMPQIEAIVGRGSSRSGIRSSVDHRGLLTDLALSDSSTELPLNELRAEVLASVQSAIADAHQQAAPLQAQIAADALPLNDTSILDALDAIVQRALAPSSSRPTGGTP